jgi:hypothetical protein
VNFGVNALHALHDSSYTLSNFKPKRAAKNAGTTDSINAITIWVSDKFIVCFYFCGCTMHKGGYSFEVGFRAGSFDKNPKTNTLTKKVTTV